jgi:hypothetical protein
VTQVEQIIFYEKWRIEKVSGRKLKEYNDYRTTWDVTNHLGMMLGRESYDHKNFSFSFF